MLYWAMLVDPVAGAVTNSARISAAASEFAAIALKI